jgi:hypothetical protein
MSKPIRLTAGMLRAMSVALGELFAREVPPEREDDEVAIMNNAGKAARWIGQELERRRIKSKRLPKQTEN